MIVPAPPTGALSRPCQTDVLGRQLHLGRQPQPLRATVEADLHPGARFRSGVAARLDRTSRAPPERPSCRPRDRSSSSARRPCGCSRGPSTSAVSSSDPSSGVAASSPSGASSPDFETGARGHPLLGQIDPAGAGQRRPRGRGAQLLDRQLFRSGLGRGQPQLHALAEQTGDRRRATAPAPEQACRRHGPGRHRLRRARPVRSARASSIGFQAKVAMPVLERAVADQRRARSCRQSGGP